MLNAGAQHAQPGLKKKKNKLEFMQEMSEARYQPKISSQISQQSQDLFLGSGSGNHIHTTITSLGKHA